MSGDDQHWRCVTACIPPSLRERHHAFRRDAQEYVDGSIDLQGLLDRLNQRYAMHSSL